MLGSRFFAENRKTSLMAHGQLSHPPLPPSEVHLVTLPDVDARWLEAVDLQACEIVNDWNARAINASVSRGLLPAQERGTATNRGAYFLLGRREEVVDLLGHTPHGLKRRCLLVSWWPTDLPFWSRRLQRRVRVNLHPQSTDRYARKYVLTSDHRC